MAPDTGSGVTVYGAAPEWTTIEPFRSRTMDPGEYRIDIYWTMTEQHCDGFGADPASNCLPRAST